LHTNEQYDNPVASFSASSGWFGCYFYFCSRLSLSFKEADIFKVFPGACLTDSIHRTIDILAQLEIVSLKVRNEAGNEVRQKS